MIDLTGFEAFYSVAHSNPNGGPGAKTLGGIVERTVARDAGVRFRELLEERGVRVETFSGPLQPKMRLVNKAIRAAQKAGRRWASVELHFNSTPLEPCEVCEEHERETMRHVGSICPVCSTRSPRSWRFGSTALAFKESWASVQLAGFVMDRIDELVPWARRPPILLPDPNYRAGWPRWVFRPNVLVEIGFGPDPVFSDWIASEENRGAYGRSVAEGVIEFFERRRDVPVDDWHV